MRFDALALAGCGTLNFYQIGVSDALQQAGLSGELLYTGSSAGAGMSALLAGGVEAREVFRLAAALLCPHHGENLLLKPSILKSFADDFLETLINEPLLEAMGSRAYLSITRLKPFGNLMVNEFSDVHDLRQAIRASCHIPSLKAPSVLFRGQRCMDGGLTLNNPRVGERCLRVSPFFFDLRMQIRPRTLIPPWWSLIIPTMERALGLFEQGRRDAEAYLSQASRALRPHSEV